MKSFNKLHGDMLAQTKSRELSDALEELNRAHQRELDALQVSDHSRRGVNVSLDTVFKHPDGARLIERAFRADPKQTAIELNYLGAHDVAGQLKVKLGMEQSASANGVAQLTTA